MKELEDLYLIAYSTKEFNVCLGIRKLQATLEGLLVNKIEHDMKPKTFADLVNQAEQDIKAESKGKSDDGKQ